MVATWVMIRTVWAFVALAGALAIWAIFWDRPRGRARCPKCWHSMAGLAERGVTVCPECGKDAKRVQRLHKTRRRWWIAILALLVAPLLPLWLLPAIERREEGWTALAPTTGVILILRWQPERQRLADGRMQPQPFWDAAWELLRVRDGRQSLEIWQIHFFGAWVVPLTQEYADSLVRRPRAWFEGEPVPVFVRKPDEVSRGRFYTIATLRDVDGRSIASDRINMFGPRSPSGWLPAQSGDRMSVAYPLEFRRPWLRSRQAGETIVQTTSFFLQFEMPLVSRHDPAAIEAISTPIRDQQADQRVHDHVRLVWMRHLRQGGLSGYFAIWDVRADCAYSFDLEVLDGERVIWVASTPVLHPAGLNHAIVHRGDDDPLRSLILDAATGEIRPGNLMIRVRSRPDLAIYDLEYDTHWEGEITRPFLELFENRHPDYRVVGEE